jgi:hypothetical protein
VAVSRAEALLLIVTVVLGCSAVAGIILAALALVG